VPIACYRPRGGLLQKLWDGVVTAVAKWVAAPNPPDRQPAAVYSAVPINGLGSVLRATWREPAMVAEKWAE